MTKPRALASALASLIAFCLGLLLVLELGLWIAPTPAMATSTTSSIIGTWEGAVDPGAQPKKRIVIHITVGQDGILSGTIDFPDQDASGTLITAITYKESVLHLESSSALASYDGTMNKDKTEITGNWTQGGSKLSLVLKRTS
jgi:hypothetical protein